MKCLFYITGVQFLVIASYFVCFDHEGMGSLCFTSVISVGKTALARELRKSEEAHKASRG